MEIKIEEGVTEISEKAYFANEEITEIVLPSTLKTIGKKAFMGAKNMKVLVLPQGIERIEENAFVKGPLFIYVPASISYIGREAFDAHAIVYFEGKQTFAAYYDYYYEADYPDSYYRGPSMGMSRIETFFYENGCQISYEKSYPEFLAMLKEKF